MNLTAVRWRNRLISAFPWISVLSAFRHFHRASRGWDHEGWTAPPPYFVRRAMLVSEASAIGAETFVETGTFLGDTTWSMRERFLQVYTIEVQPALSALAKDRFLRHPSITVIQGDSASILVDLCKKIVTPCLFYLDGHYSGGETGMGEKECPVIEELTAIFGETIHPFRIVIDDARLFGNHPAYPSLANIDAFLSKQPCGKQMRVENDAIIIF